MVGNPQSREILAIHMFASEVFGIFIESELFNPSFYTFIKKKEKENASKPETWRTGLFCIVFVTAFKMDAGIKFFPVLI